MLPVGKMEVQAMGGVFMCSGIEREQSESTSREDYVEWGIFMC